MNAEGEQYLDCTNGHRSHWVRRFARCGAEYSCRRERSSIVAVFIDQLAAYSVIGERRGGVMRPRPGGGHFRLLVARRRSTTSRRAPSANFPSNSCKAQSPPSAPKLLPVWSANSITGRPTHLRGNNSRGFEKKNAATHYHLPAAVL